MLEEIHLTWSDIYHIKHLDVVPNSPGIYLWLFNVDGELIPYYVGKSSNIRKRLGDHFSCLIGGLYDIYPMADIRKFVKYKRDKAGLIYCPTSDLKLLEFAEQFDFIRPHLENMIKSFFFTFAPYEHKREDINESSALQDIEKSIISMIGFDNLSNTNGGDFYYFNVHHKPPSQIKQYFKN